MRLHSPEIHAETCDKQLNADFNTLEMHAWHAQSSSDHKNMVLFLGAVLALTRAYQKNPNVSDVVDTLFEGTVSLREIEPTLMFNESEDVIAVEALGHKAKTRIEVEASADLLFLVHVAQLALRGSQENLFLERPALQAEFHDALGRLGVSEEKAAALKDVISNADLDGEVSLIDEFVDHERKSQVGFEKDEWLYPLQDSFTRSNEPYIRPIDPHEYRELSVS